MSFLSRYRVAKTPEERTEQRIQLSLGLLSGVLLGLAFPPIPLPILIFIGLIPYLFVLDNRNGLGEINRFTYFFAFFFNITTLYWVGSWTPDADPFLMIAGSVLMFFNPLLFLIPSTLYYFCSKIFNKKVGLYLLPVFWVTYEYLYSLTDFRFPWLTLGNSLPYLTSFIQIADVVGAYGLSLIILYINIFLFLTLKAYLDEKRIKVIPISLTLILIIIPLVYGIIRLNTYEPSKDEITMGVVQPNLDPWNKWEAGSLEEQLTLYLNISKNAIEEGAEILFWPETALPVYLLTRAHSYVAQKIKTFVDSNSVFLMTGMPDATYYPNKEKAPDYAKPLKNSTYLYTSYNSVLFYTPEENEIQKYGKIKLVPFGEKVPLVEYIPILGDIIKWNVGITSWNVGMDTTVFSIPLEKLKGNSDRRKLTSNDTVYAAGVVCIESIYPDFIASFVQRGANFIAVVTNDSWYGNSSGPYQHKEISVLRAVENRRSVIRAANGGISCIINPIGETVIDTEMFTQTYFTGKIPIENNFTFYTQNPLIIPVICSAFSLWIFGIFVLKKLKIVMKL